MVASVVVVVAIAVAIPATTTCVVGFEGEDWVVAPGAIAPEVAAMEFDFSECCSCY